MKRRVLVVDDEKGIREALKQVLEYEAIEVQTCASGGEAPRAGRTENLRHRGCGRSVWAPRGKAVRVVAGDLESITVDAVMEAAVSLVSGKRAAP